MSFNRENRIRFLLERIVEFQEFDDLECSLQFKDIHKENEKQEEIQRFYEERLDPMQLFYESAEFGIPSYNIPDFQNLG